MYVIVAEFAVKRETIDTFGRLIDRQAKDSVDLEIDCHQFDVYQDETDSSRFLLYEIYTDKVAFEKHRTLPNTSKFLEEAGSMILERTIRGFHRREAA